MIIFKKAQDLTQYIENQLNNGKKVGCIPTMGALHYAHIELVKQAMTENDIAVCSIFVNPVQFNNITDFEKYPSTIAADILQLENIGCDILFLPETAEIYPDGTANPPYYPIGYLDNTLEGAHRPGHFQGVCWVVDRLLQIIKPHKLYLGLKDYQQVMVIKKMIQLKKYEVQIIPVNTLREAGGLAASSRNMRLSTNGRQQATGIYETLLFLKKHIKPGELKELEQQAVALLTLKGFKVDYVEIADEATLTLPESWDGKKKLRALIAASLEDVRLIDNMQITE